MTSLPVPTGRLALVALVVALPVLVVGSWPAFVAVQVVVVAAAVVDLALTVDPAAVRVERRMPEVVALGDEADLAWRVSCPRGAVAAQVGDDLAPSLRVTRRSFSVRVPAGKLIEVTASMRPARRGRFDPRWVTIRTTGPLGLVARQATLDRPGRLRVLPMFRSRRATDLRVERARLLDVGLQSAKGRGGGTEFDQLREYTPDDQFRRIDWAATARLGKPIVRDYRAERNQTILCLLDNGRVMAGRVDGVPRVEHAMDAVMALTTLATRVGDRAGLVAFDQVVRAVVPPAAGRSQTGQVTEAMIDLEPVLAESDYRGAFTETLARFRRRMLLVVFTDLVEQSVGETLLPALPVITRAHLVLVAAVQDSNVVEWAAEPAADGTEVYRRAAATGSLAERARTTAKLRGLGATVVDAPPHRLAPALTDAYLRLKATGRL
jgi:uncharacterized protein (DUF58 family)